MVIFGAGVLTGALVMQFNSVAPSPKHQRLGFTGSPGGMRLEFLRRTQRELNLTSEQQERIDKLLKQSQERTRKLMEPVSPQLHQELQRARAEFREVLTPAQQLRFEDLLKQQQRFREHRPGSRVEPAWSTNGPVTNSI